MHYRLYEKIIKVKAAVATISKILILGHPIRLKSSARLFSLAAQV